MAVLDLFSLVTGGLPRASHRATVILDSHHPRVRSVLGIGVDEAMRVASLSAAAVSNEDNMFVVDRITTDGFEVSILNPDVLFDENWAPAEERTDA